MADAKAKRLEFAVSLERGCFVGASLTAKPRYRWTVNGKEIEPA